ncbi:inhibitor of apoptosis-promoting Bax1-domain-containing protein [Haematococcus lacustris]
MAYYNPLVDEEAGYYRSGSKRSLDPSYEFADSIVRQGFIRKVFGLLALQLAITAGTTAAFLFSAPVKGFVASNPWTLWTAMGLSFVLVLLLSFWDAARRQHPLNLVFLFAFTACESVLVGAASATYDTHVVLLAVGITAGVVMALALFALQTKLDLTAAGGALLALLATLIIASIVQSFVHVSWLQLLISAGGALLFSVYLVFDIQLLMGSGAVSISPDEYVYAALALYLDVINLFLYVLQLLNEVSRND